MQSCPAMRETGPIGRPDANRQGWRVTLAFACLLGFARAEGQGVAAAAPPGAATPASPGDVDERLRRLEGLVGELVEQNQRLTQENRELSRAIRSLGLPPADPGVAPAQSAPAEAPTPPPALPAPDDPPAPVASGERPGGSVPAAIPRDADSQIFANLLDSGAVLSPNRIESKGPIGRYDEGYVLVAPDEDGRPPFALKFNLTTQFRYTGFARADESWVDSAGVVRPIRNQSNFELNRAWFTFSGFAFTPKLRYSASVFTTTTSNKTLPLWLITYEFGKALSLSGGNFKVPGTREWIESNRYVLGTDRTMANTFFRPSISPGVWINGEPFDGLFYFAGVYNDFNAAALGPDRLNTNMTYSGNLWWEPLGAFGKGYSDQEIHETPVMRTGGSLSFHRSFRELDLAQGQTNPENTILRLSDGTPLYQQGALAPGVMLTAADVLLLSYDLAFKYRGFSLSGEYYARWIGDMDAKGGAIPLRDRRLFDTGGFVQLSYALIPRRLELFARSSLVAGPFGEGSEYGGGLNWYAFSNRNVRGTFEAKKINHSPADNALYGYFAGESGMLFQVQLMTDF